MISTDIIGPFPRSSKGSTCVLEVVDYFSKYTLLFPMRKATAETVSRLIENEVFLVYGVPEILVTDNGRQYTSNIFTKLLKEYDVRVTYNAVYHPQANPTERTNRVIKTMISCYVQENQKKWDSQLFKLGCALRTARHEVTKHTPYRINFGKEMMLNGKDYEDRQRRAVLVENDTNEETGHKETMLNNLRERVFNKLTEAQEVSRKRYNLRRRDVVYKQGDFVWKREFALSNAEKYFNAKLGKKFSGPYVIRRVVGRNTYELEDSFGNSKGVWHTQDLKPDFSHEGLDTLSE